ncbi:hypothetical protein GCM10027596_40730 [Nocardioides korecus]
MTGLFEQFLLMPTWVLLVMVFTLPALESSAFLGFVFPGETALLLGGVAAGMGHLPLLAVIATGIAGAVLGDAVGFWVGRRWGRRVLDSTLGRIVPSHHLERAEHALRHRGVAAVFLGRFTAALRVMVPGLAGMSGMAPKRFLAANVSGGVVWAALVATIGFLAGDSWHTVEGYVSHAGLALAGLVVAWLIGRRVLRRWRRPTGPDTAEGPALHSGTEPVSRDTTRAPRAGRSEVRPVSSMQTLPTSPRRLASTASTLRKGMRLMEGLLHGVFTVVVIVISVVALLILVTALEPGGARRRKERDQPQSRLPDRP